MHVNVKVSGLSPGLHGIHVHGIGVCAPATFASAGGHHNPRNVVHGAHAGDLPNLVVNDAGRGTLNAHLDHFTLTPSATSLFDADGSAIIIHANPDDYVNLPSSGARVACGVITAG